ncbi:chemotaxis-specific protein-glutamate methyltransferase CheB [Pelagicoccus sp. SDUM812003]|uniref:chemotaxis-specific protein-glutamate methyltransferase CheB n=1 Tax=Pelagicoccus sp. SDUM812003 TaxID=3041267 RepID=UPI00280DCA27|nr:chemotaxis-specific protein-glutamate methyltransferase CheB [Pelagicoccus sp. SDUM812003]MDQ8203334.1 chemotaxis-specific protein-glutamate methyltransferase CheB [Pelagicoccus sp. SDUM812003]
MELNVFAVDGSVNVRKRLGDAVKATPGLLLSGVASTASIALQKLKSIPADIIVLDTDIEVDDTLAFIRSVAQQSPDAYLILFGSGLARGGSMVLDGISAGAHDYLRKPSGHPLKDPEWACVETELIPMLARRAANLPRRPSKPDDRSPLLEEEPMVTLERATRKVGDRIRNEVKAEEAKCAKRHGLPKIVCIGSSTGGPNALSDLFSQFPKRFPVPIVVTQHMPPMFTRMLAQRLNGLDTLVFHEGEEGMALEAGHVYIAPGGKHMTIRSDGGALRLGLNEEPPENSCRPAVDVMLRSVAETVGGAALVTILTGMGKDGFQGCRELVGLGATVFAQDEETSVVWGMPGYVASAGLADRVLPLSEIAQAMNEFVGNCPVRPSR